MKHLTRLNATGLPAGAISSTATHELTEGWSVTRSAPGGFAGAEAAMAATGWTEARVPGTVASSLGPEGPGGHEDYDAADWWYRCRFPYTEVMPAERVRLRFDGLSTLSDVWLNGTQILTSSNMFHVHEADITDLLRPDNDLVIAFRSLGSALAERRPRPRWKTKLVEHQQLRWFRTTLLGRIPGWTPPIRPVGPWRSVWIESVTGPEPTSLEVRSAVVDGRGVVEVEGALTVPDETEPRRAILRVGDAEAEIGLERRGDDWWLSGSLRIESPRLWWPHTHGDPTLHSVHIDIDTPLGTTRVACGEIGFRTVEIDRSDGHVDFLINGTPIFCRGACWTTNDLVSLVGDPAALRDTLELTAEANANMVRVGGTMVYETDDFYRTCDRLGLMVWQDFMFANMDYPVEDAAFAAEIEAEATQQIGRLSRHPCVVAWCGGSEVEQQAAMFGADREIWCNDFFSETLPSLIEQRAPGAPYWTSTPTGGVLPFHVGEGVTHYYGVGAYRRPVEDVRLANVKFTPECLGFSNVPEPSNLRALTPDGSVAPHHPAWKSGVPRDSGAGWDFEDVRDHYFEVIHGVGAVSMRSDDPDHYMRLARTVTGRVMERVFDEWRSPESACGGALVWFLKDLRPGAGWGIIDSDGNPKAAYYFLKRAWAPLRISVLDRGLDGLRIELHNEGAEPVAGHMTVKVIASTSATVAEAGRQVTVPARDTLAVSGEELLGHFADSTNAYRFGPPRHAAIEVSFHAAGHPQPIRTVYWPSMSSPLMPVQLTGTVDTGGRAGSAQSTGLTRDVRIELKGAVPSQNYFDLAPGVDARFVYRVEADTATTRGFLDAPNAPEGSRFKVCE